MSSIANMTPDYGFYGLEIDDLKVQIHPDYSIPACHTLDRTFYTVQLYLWTLGVRAELDIVATCVRRYCYMPTQGIDNESLARVLQAVKQVHIEGKYNA
jgi:hypothetical protein